MMGVDLLSSIHGHNEQNTRIESHNLGITHVLLQIQMVYRITIN